MSHDPVARLTWLRAIGRTCTGAAVRVAFAIEERYNGRSGCCWPSVARLAEDCRMTARSVQLGLRELERLGFLVSDRPATQGRGLTTTYLPQWSAGQSAAPAEPRAEPPERVKTVSPIDPQKGEKYFAERVKEISPEPSEENQAKTPTSPSSSNASPTSPTTATTTPAAQRVVIDPDPIRRAVHQADPVALVAACGGTVRRNGTEWLAAAHGLQIGELAVVLWLALADDDPIRHPSGLRRARRRWTSESLTARRAWATTAAQAIGFPPPLNAAQAA